MILRKRSPMRAAASFPKVDRLNSVISTSQESAEFSAIYSKRRKNSVTTMIPHGHGCTVVLFGFGGIPLGLQGGTKQIHMEMPGNASKPRMDTASQLVTC